MYPTGCPSFQKLSIKLFKVEEVDNAGKGQKQKLRLVDSQFSSNRDGFGFMLKNLTAGQYQLQVKKYSLGFDVYDVTARIYSKKNLKMIDVEEQEIKKAKDEKRSSVWIDRTIVALNDINPSAYPLEKPEARGDSDASVIPSSGPLSQPEPSADEEDGQ